MVPAGTAAVALAGAVPDEVPVAAPCVDPVGGLCCHIPTI